MTRIDSRIADGDITEFSLIWCGYYYSTWFKTIMNWMNMMFRQPHALSNVRISYNLTLTLCLTWLNFAVLQPWCVQTSWLPQPGPDVLHVNGCVFTQPTPGHCAAVWSALVLCCCARVSLKLTTDSTNVCLECQCCSPGSCESISGIGDFWRDLTNGLYFSFLNALAFRLAS